MKNMKVISLENQLDRARITTLSHDGRGVATINQKKAFVVGALPNEVVTYEITRKRSQLIEANVLEVIEPSVDRTKPPCDHFGLCGGCSLQHMSMATQIELKQQTLLNQLKHFGHVTPETILPPLNAHSEGYRRKARLGVKYVFKKNKLLIGFREKSSRYLADLNSCKTLHPAIGERLSELSELIASLSIYEHVPQIEVAIGDEQAALIIRHMKPLTDEDKAKLTDYATSQAFHLYLQPNAPEPITKLWPADQDHRLTYTLPEQALTFSFHPLDFTQINLEMNRLMVAQALSELALTPADRVLDLFCGIGNFTLPIARHAQHVTGVEGAIEMTERAAENAKANRLTNVAFHAANLATPPATAPWLTTYDKVLLDPPRVGANEMLKPIASMQATRLVYISCNPATLARDAGELVHEHGYRLTKAGIMNMFPHTTHIEAMAVFERR